MKKIKIVFIALSMLILACQKNEDSDNQKNILDSNNKTVLDVVPKLLSVQLEIPVQKAAETNLEFVRGGYASAKMPLVIDAGGYPNHILFEFAVENSSKYNLFAIYAASLSRPVDVYLNGKIVLKQVGGKTTGGWISDKAKKIKLGKITLQSNRVNRIKLQRNGPFFHMASITIEK